MVTGVTLWTIRISTALYLLAIRDWIAGNDGRARVLWAVGCAFYVAHAIAAFHFQYEWSHAVAVRETARQTKALFGVDDGSGIYWNYLFTAVWLGDVLFGANKKPWIAWCVHGFLGFMFLNGAIVFASPAMRRATSISAIALFVYWLWTKRRWTKRPSRPVPIRY
jgi:hypothetical protein